MFTLVICLIRSHWVIKSNASDYGNIQLHSNFYYNQLNGHLFATDHKLFIPLHFDWPISFQRDWQMFNCHDNNDCFWTTHPFKFKYLCNLIVLTCLGWNDKATGRWIFMHGNWPTDGAVHSIMLLCFSGCRDFAGFEWQNLLSESNNHISRVEDRKVLSVISVVALYFNHFAFNLRYFRAKQ